MRNIPRKNQHCMKTPSRIHNPLDTIQNITDFVQGNCLQGSYAAVVLIELV